MYLGCCLEPKLLQQLERLQILSLNELLSEELDTVLGTNQSLLFSLMPGSQLPP